LNVITFVGVGDRICHQSEVSLLQLLYAMDLVLFLFYDNSVNAFHINNECQNQQCIK